MEAKLIVIGGKANKGEIALKIPAIIGRSREAGLTIAHPMVSRQHCEIFEAEGLLRLRDLGSLNGTYIGQRQIIEAPLRPNDEFTVGPLTFRVFYEYAGDVTVEGEGDDQAASTDALPQVSPQGPSASAEPPIASPIAAPPHEPKAGIHSAPLNSLFPVDSPVPDFSTWGVISEESDELCTPLEPPPAEVHLSQTEPADSQEYPPWEPNGGPAEDADVGLTSPTIPDEVGAPENRGDPPPGHAAVDSGAAKRSWWHFGRSKAETPSSGLRESPRSIPRSSGSDLPTSTGPGTAPSADSAARDAEGDLDRFFRDIQGPGSNP